MPAYEPAGRVRIGKHDRLGTVFRENNETLSDRAARQCVDPDPDIAQYPHGGRVQPFPRQSRGSSRIGFEQGDAGALAHMGERAQAADRAGADDGYVVTERNGGAHRNTLACGRRR